MRLFWSCYRCNEILCSDIFNLRLFHGRYELVIIFKGKIILWVLPTTASGHCPLQRGCWETLRALQRLLVFLKRSRFLRGIQKSKGPIKPPSAASLLTHLVLYVCWSSDLSNLYYVFSSGLLPVLCLGIILTSLLLLPLLAVFLRRPRQQAPPTPENQTKILVWFILFFHSSQNSLIQKYTAYCFIFISFLSLRHQSTMQFLWSPFPWFLSTPVTSTWNSPTTKSPSNPLLVFPPMRTRPWHSPVMISITTPARVQRTGTAMEIEMELEQERGLDSGISIPPVSHSSEETCGSNGDWNINWLRAILLWVLVWVCRARLHHNTVLHTTASVIYWSPLEMPG